jgi:formamidopyrimidine-DNA glycosylase
MPELPDITLYLDALQRFIGDKRIERIQLRSAFLVRSVEPDLMAAEGKCIRGFRRQGKRIVWELEDDLFLVFHLMIAGRFHWRKTGATPRGKNDLAAFAFDHGVLMLTEASQKKRAALYVVAGEPNLLEHTRGGLEVLGCDEAGFRAALRSENHTLKRALTDPRLFSGIGNAYSDEILHAARLSPVKLTSRLSDEEVSRLFNAAQTTLREWATRLIEQTGDRFPEKVTAFRPEMSVHGKYGQPCTECGTAIQRVVRAENETNYCPRCQTGGKVLKDRSLSRLLRDDWPKSIDELE